ncbi:MAG: hypothetical protein WDZ69_02845 [Candidatus Pacearchaeota archaeon]
MKIIGDKLGEKGMKRFVLALLVLAVILSTAFLVSAQFSSSSYSKEYVENGQFDPTVRRAVDPGFTGFDRGMCESGQDFLLQVSPTGCAPSIVRSDLLESQNVPVFCPIVATKLNPLIDVDTIDRVTFSPEGRPEGVSGVGFQPARAALGRPGAELTQPVLNNVGYAVIVLRQERNESAMPDFVEGNLTARIRYDVHNAFGVGQSSFYLPVMSDTEWNRDFVQSSFWQGRGFLRAESVNDDRASISVYSDRETGSRTGTNKRRVATENLVVGESSRDIFMPGFNFCAGSMNLRLDDIENPDTTARLEINGDVFEFREGERFLDNDCRVRRVEKQGIVESADISCRADEGSGNLHLKVSPRVNISVEGIDRYYSVGDALLGEDGRPLMAAEGEKTVYLAYVTTKGNTRSNEDLVAGLAAVPGTRERLSNSELEDFADFFNEAPNGDISAFLSTVYATKGEEGVRIDNFATLGRTLIGQGKAIYKYIVSGIFFESISFQESRLIFSGGSEEGKEAFIEGFADAVDADLSELGDEDRENYENAVEDYNDVLDGFAGDRYPPELDNEPTFGERALRGMIELQEGTGQKRSVVELCEEFEDSYPDSMNENPPKDCVEEHRLASPESSMGSVLVKGRTYSISLDRVREPTFDDFGAVVSVRMPDGSTEGIHLRKDSVRVLNHTSGAFIQLVDMSRDSSGEISVRIRTNLREGFVEGVERAFVGQVTRITLREGLPDSRGGYTFSLQQANLNEVAKVSVQPKVRFQETEAEFPFRIGIEKRAIQLSPEKTRERIDSLDEKLERWRNINEKLGTAVELGNKACLGVGAALTVKNFFSNLQGEGIARQKVMRGPGGYYEICESEIAGTGESMDSCLLDKNDRIESAVNEVAEALEKHNEEMKKIQEGITTSHFLGEDVVDTGAFMEKLVDDDYRNELSGNLEGIETIKIEGRDVPVSSIIGNMTPETTYVTQARDLQLNARLLNSDNSVVSDVARGDIESALGDIYVNSNRDSKRRSISEDTGFSNPIIGSTEKLTKIPFTTRTTFGQVEDKFSGAQINDDESVQLFENEADGQIYLLVLNENDVIQETYVVGEGNSLERHGTKDDPKHPNPLGLSFNYYEKETYDNECSNCELRYYETGQYAGLPAIVPFPAPPGLGDGWYAAIKSSLPIGGQVRAFEDSGRVSSFYLCNVGENGREEFFSGVGDDDCVLMNPGLSQPYTNFPGLDENDAFLLTDRAVQAIAQASRKHSAGLSSISLFGETIDVGEPAVGVPDVECQDFMSAKECSIMFNICDPVVCPSSRCNLGGNYHVRDVVQSGVIGSIALCYPNAAWAGGDVYVPICLSGVHAGLEGYLSVLDNYQQCLEHSLETGQQIGICDQLHSVYMCDFFWRQALPVANAVIPEVLGKVLGGQTTRGGGEYMDVRDAWQKAGESADFFTQEYAVNSANAFRVRSMEGVGTEVCKNWVSIAGPDTGSLIDSITKPRVPAQFYGRFDEIPFTSATTPPTSHYKTFYHIYAGEDVSAYYQVYLRSTGESFYQDTPSRRVVATGFIPAGDSATCGSNPNQPCDFTAPSGFNELCIVVNGQEECGFGQVTTDFAPNYLSDRFISDQVSRTDISSERECVSGTTNIESIINPSIREGVDPSLHNRGITRICATDNPGSATDAAAGTEDSRWVRVGHCDSPQIGCWLDRRSVENTVKHEGLREKALNDSAVDYLEVLRNETGALSDDEFRDVVGEIEDLESKGNPVSLIEKVNENIEKVFLSYEKGFLTLVRGDAYRKLAVAAYQKLLDENEGDCTEDEDCPDGKVCEDSLCVDPDGDDDGEDGIDEILEVTNPATEEELRSLGVDYPVFAFGDGRFFFGQNIYYTFIDGNWYWSLDGESPGEGGEWFDVRHIDYTLNRTPPKDDDVPTRIEDIEPGQFDDPGFETAAPDNTRVEIPEGITLPSENLLSENREFTESGLKGKSYLEGLEFLIDRVEQNDEKSRIPLLGITLRNSKLSTEKVGFSHRGRFSVARRYDGGDFEGDYDLYFEYSEDEGEWMYAIEDISLMAPVSGEIPESRLVGSGFGRTEISIAEDGTRNIIMSLRDRGFLEGAAVIFSIDLNLNEEDVGSGRSLFDIDDSDFSSPGFETAAPDNTRVSPPEIGFGCTTKEECQEDIGYKIIDIASDIKQERGSPPFMSDGVVSEDNGGRIASFECLALAVAYHESEIQHCNQIHQGEDPLYCNENSSEVILGDEGASFGVMQINTAFTRQDTGQDVGHCGDYGLSSNHEECIDQLSDAEKNMEVGLNLLADEYDSFERVYSCYRQERHGSVVRESDFINLAYRGWQRALRSYNGWNSQCTYEKDDGSLGLIGDPRYVENVGSTENLDKLKEMFPEVC